MEGAVDRQTPAARKYIDGRINDYRKYYDSKSVFCKTRFIAMRTIAVTGGVLIPVFVNLQFAYHNVISTVASVVVAASVALESVYHYREQWKNYRSTEQVLGHEVIYFETITGPYEKMKDAEERLKLLIERCEKTIAAENAATLDVMTLAGGRAAGDSDQSPSASR